MKVLQLYSDLIWLWGRGSERKRKRENDLQFDRSHNRLTGLTILEWRKWLNRCRAADGWQLPWIFHSCRQHGAAAEEEEALLRRRPVGHRTSVPSVYELRRCSDTGSGQPGRCSDTGSGQGSGQPADQSTWGRPSEWRVRQPSLPRIRLSTRAQPRRRTRGFLGHTRDGNSDESSTAHCWAFANIVPDGEKNHGGSFYENIIWLYNEAWWYSLIALKSERFAITFDLYSNY